MPELKRSEYQLNLKIYKPSEIVSLIQNSEDIFQTIDFVNTFCHNQPEIEKTKELIDRLFNDSKNANDEKVELIDHFLFKNRFFDELKEFRKLHNNNHFVSIDATNENNYDVDEIISYFLNVENPELKDNEFELLLNKLLENEELFQIYLSFKTYKYSDKVFKVDNFLRIYNVEYTKYQDKFINVVNKIYILNENEKSLLRNPNFSIYSLKIPEYCSSIVTKLFKEIERKDGNYQAFFCLKNIANEFPLLFYNRHQEVFEKVLHSFEHFSLIFKENFYNEEQLKLAKTAYSSFSFFVSTFQMPIMFDKFILWINENILSFSCSQIAGFVTVINYLCNDKYIKNSIIIYSYKINLFETIGKLLQIENEKEENQRFVDYYKTSLYSFYRIIFENLNNKTKYELIQFDELKKIENPFNYIISNILHSSIWVYLGENVQMKGVSSSLSDFIRITDSIRDFWVSFHFARVRERKATDEQINGFIENFINKSNQVDYDVPQFPSSFTIKMIRYLSLKQQFLFDLILDKKSIPLVPLYYEMICEANDEIKSLKNDADENPEDEENKDVQSFNTSNIFLSLISQQNLKLYHLTILFFFQFLIFCIKI